MSENKLTMRELLIHEAATEAGEIAGYDKGFNAGVEAAAKWVDKDVRAWERFFHERKELAEISAELRSLKKPEREDTK